MPQEKSDEGKRKRILGLDDDDEELKYLEEIVLGDGDDIFDDQQPEGVDEPEEETKEPAWVDEADDVTGPCISGTGSDKRDKKFREMKFLQVSKKPKWASYSQKPDANDILKRTGNIIKKTNSLNQGLIEIKKLNDLNSQTYNEGPIRAIKFHPTSTIALVTGLSGVVSLFQVDGKENTKLQSTKYHKFPIDCASFINNGEEYIIGSGSTPQFHTFNLMTGQSFKTSHKKLDGMTNMKKFTVSPDDKYIAVAGSNGKVYLLSGRTKECVDNFQLNSHVKDISFSHDGSTMYLHTDDGEVYLWDMKTRRCIQKFTDDGCLAGTTIDISSNSALLACGSSSGVVNIYDVNNVRSHQYKPLKVLYNLVTPITYIKFNPTSEILCISSVHKEAAVKLVHLSSMTVFSNFPNEKNKLNHVTCIDFSPNSGYMAVGDSKRIAHLYRLKYYGNY